MTRISPAALTSRSARAQEMRLPFSAMNDAGGHARIEIADWSRLPDRQMLDTEMKEVLARAIQGLPENYRAVILLRDMEELSTLETAQILDLTEDVVKTRLHRARLAVRRELDDYLRTDGRIEPGHV